MKEIPVSPRSSPTWQKTKMVAVWVTTLGFCTVSWFDANDKLKFRLPGWGVKLFTKVFGEDGGK